MRSTRAFTLIELMITVAICGVLASVGMTAYGRFISKAKRAEGFAQMGAISKSVMAYYYNDTADQGVGAAARTHCLPGGNVGNCGCGTYNTLNGEKVTVDCSASNTFGAIGYNPVGGSYHYFTACPNTDVVPDVWNGACDIPAGEDYVFHVNMFSDDDDDDVYGLWWMYMATDPNGDIVRSNIFETPFGQGFGVALTESE